MLTLAHDHDSLGTDEARAVVSLACGASFGLEGRARSGRGPGAAHSRLGGALARGRAARSARGPGWRTRGRAVPLPGPGGAFGSGAWRHTRGRVVPLPGAARRPRAPGYPSARPHPSRPVLSALRHPKSGPCSADGAPWIPVCHAFATTRGIQRAAAVFNGIPPRRNYSRTLQSADDKQGFRGPFSGRNPARGSRAGPARAQRPRSKSESQPREHGAPRSVPEAPTAGHEHSARDQA